MHTHAKMIIYIFILIISIQCAAKCVADCVADCVVGCVVSCVADTRKMPYSSGFRCVVSCVAGHVVGCVVGCVVECVTRKQLARYHSAAGRVGYSIQARTGSAVRAHGQRSGDTRKRLQTGGASVAGGGWL